MKKWLRNNRLLVIGFLAGAGGGFLYWKYVGVTLSYWPRVLVPVQLILYGGAAGALLLTAVQQIGSGRRKHSRKEQESR